MYWFIQPVLSVYCWQLMFIFLWSHPPLYADASLNIYYFANECIWLVQLGAEKGCESLYLSDQLVQQEGTEHRSWLFLFFWIAIYFVLQQFTNSNTPILDSLVSSSAITAMWWMAKRKIENWLAWIFSNIVAIPLNFYKELMLFTLMYVLFLALGMVGIY